MTESEYGCFDKNGAHYVIKTPGTPDTWYNYLFNDDYHLKVSQTGQGVSTCLSPVARTFTRGYRFFYLSDRRTGDCWCPTYRPLRTRLDSFACIHALGWTEFRTRFQGIETSLKVFVPLKGPREIWIYRLGNNSGDGRELSAYTAFSFEAGRIMGTKCSYDPATRIITCFAYPHHQFYEDKAKLERSKSYIYMFSDTDVASYDCSERRFFGGDDLTEKPSAVGRGACSNLPSEWDYPTGVFQHNFTLPAGAEIEFAIVLGCADGPGEAVSVKEETLRDERIHQELDRVERYWEGICRRVTIQTPDGDLDRFANYWLKKQVVAQARCRRNAALAPVRNDLQDAMGYSLLDADGAAQLMRGILREQETNGFLQQWRLRSDLFAQKGMAAIAAMKHKDAPPWLVICVCALVQQLGDLAFLDEKVSFRDGEIETTVYDHLLRAVEYASVDVGTHGLSLMGDGDWTDPINGPGRLGRGESVWTTMALKYAIQQLLPLCRQMGDEAKAERLEELEAGLDRAINGTCWDGEWYLAGYDDDSIPFGTSDDSEGRIFLNTQTWSVISQSARDERLGKTLAAIDRLDSPCGPILLWPPFSGWDPRLGKISVKLAGTTENGSVYCHASMFKAYADCLAGHGSKAYDTIRKTLPTNPENPPARNLQVPIFLPNFYFGLRDSPNFGQSSQHNQTGTAPWMLWIIVEYLLGARATVDGLRIDPCIPGEWKEFSVARDFRKARYSIAVRNPDGVQKGVKVIAVDGRRVKGNLLPYAEGHVYSVEVLMG